jgi:hypothetical protein
MNKLVWSKTGDNIDLSPCNYPVYEYLVNILRQKNTKYKTSIQEIESMVQELEILFETISQNSLLKLGKPLFNNMTIDPFDQLTLNKAHNLLILSQIDNPEHCSTEWETRSRINKLIHALEKVFNKLQLDAVDGNYDFPNVFDTRSISGFQSANLAFEYHFFGRSMFDKWNNFDDNIDDVELNDFRTFNTQLVLGFKKSWSSTMPIEYEQWANKLNVEPIAPVIALANIKDLEVHLKTYRELMYRNCKIQDNFIILE